MPAMRAAPSRSRKCQTETQWLTLREVPQLAAEWHTERNAPLTPEQVAAKSRRKAWWQCATCGNEWEAEIYSRASGHGCRSCADRQRAVDFGAAEQGQSLAEKDPEIAAQWHPSRNGTLRASDVTANSGRTVWWLCDRRHQWQAMINNRRKAQGCPKCTLWEQASRKYVSGMNY